MNLHWQPLRIEDAEAWSELSKAIAAEDRHHWIVSPQNAKDRLSSPNLDREADTWAVWDGDNLVAYAISSVADAPRFDGKVHSYLTGGVHPKWRGRGIGTELLARVNQRAASALRAKYPDVPKVLFIESGDDLDPAIGLLTDNGFEISRHFHDMERDAKSAACLPDRSHPHEGIVVRPLTPDDEEQTRLAHNDAFRTHWGTAPSSVQEWHDDFDEGRIDFSRSRIAVTDDGRVLAYVLVSTTKPERPYVELVGSREEARGMGLGRATLTESLRALAADPQVQTIALDVDAENPSGAVKLYKDLGFEITRTWSALEKPID